MMSEKVGGGKKKCSSTTKAGQTHLSLRVFRTWCCHLHCTFASDLLSSAESPPRFRKAQALLSESIAWDHKNHISPRLDLTSNCLICRVLPRGLHHHLTITSRRRLGVSVRKIKITFGKFQLLADNHLGLNPYAPAPLNNATRAALTSSAQLHNSVPFRSLTVE